eukprot:s304_g37.t1
MTCQEAPTAHKAPRTAAAILFEAGKRFKDLSWWVLSPDFLQDEETEFGILRRLRQVAEQEDLPGVEFHCQAEGPRGLRNGVHSFLQKLGNPEDSAVVLLDEAYPSVPIGGRFVSKLLPDANTFPARRVVFFLGCPRAVTSVQEAAIAWAAEKANWQLLRFSLGWISEFTSKIVSRLKLLHACRKLLPILGGLLCQERGTATWCSPQCGLTQDSFSWPSPNRIDKFEAGIGPRLHFIVHVPLELKDMKISTWSPSHSRVARCCLAALWRAHGAYYRCMVSFIFEDESRQPGGLAVATVSRKFAGRFMGKAATEHDVLTALCSAINDAKKRPLHKQKPWKRAVCVQRLQEGGQWGEEVLAHPKNSVVELMVWTDKVNCSNEWSGGTLSLASSCACRDVVVVHIADAEDQLPICLKTVHAALRPDVLATSSAEVVCILQSALLDSGVAGQALLTMLLTDAKERFAAWACCWICQRERERELNYYELARQFDFEAQVASFWKGPHS